MREKYRIEEQEKDKKNGRHQHDQSSEHPFRVVFRQSAGFKRNETD